MIFAPDSNHEITSVRDLLHGIDHRDLFICEARTFFEVRVFHPNVGKAGEQTWILMEEKDRVVSVKTCGRYDSKPGIWCRYHPDVLTDHIVPTGSPSVSVLCP
jgi:hypothetical protein